MSTLRAYVSLRGRNAMAFAVALLPSITGLTGIVVLSQPARALLAPCEDSPGRGADDTLPPKKPQPKPQPPQPRDPSRPSTCG